MIYFTSDTHFNHENIIEFCHRPFRNVEQMNETIIKNWNNVVAPEDTVYHLGDFCLGGLYEIRQLRYRLNGHIHLILGNHNQKAYRNGWLDDIFDSVSYQEVLNLEGKKIYQNHFPFLCFDGEHGKAWQLFGHVYSGPSSEKNARGFDIPRLKMLFPTQYDVGVDNNNFTPVSYEQLTKIIK